MNAKSMDSNEIKAVGIDLLKEIDSFCNKNNLKYYLCYGTLLGAVRHQGFIPWDDDIDIMMPREDYDKFVKFAKNGIGKSIKLLYPEFTSDFFRPFARVYDSRTILHFETRQMDVDMGVWVDIFPLDGLPNSKIRQKIHFAIQTIYRYLILAYYTSHKARSIVREIIRKVLKIIITKNVCRKLVRASMKRSKKYPYHQSQYVAISLAAYGGRNAIKREHIESVLRLPFEHYEFNVPVGYHSILENLYGDYRKLPPISQRVAHHDYRAYWK